MHNEIALPIAARPAPGGFERRAHECIKTVRFFGQVGRGHNCARPVRANLFRADPARWTGRGMLSRPTTGLS